MERLPKADIETLIAAALITAANGKKKQQAQESPKEGEKECEAMYNSIEITFKSGDTVTYNSGEWDDYSFIGSAVVVKKNSTWIGIYNFDNVFCVELKK
jgi:hypothetical protein